MHRDNGTRVPVLEKTEVSLVATTVAFQSFKARKLYLTLQITIIGFAASIMRIVAEKLCSRYLQIRVGEG